MSEGEIIHSTVRPVDGEHLIGEPINGMKKSENLQCWPLILSSLPLPYRERCYLLISVSLSANGYAISIYVIRKYTLKVYQLDLLSH